MRSWRDNLLGGARFQLCWSWWNTKDNPGDSTQVILWVGFNLVRVGLFWYLVFQLTLYKWGWVISQVERGYITVSVHNRVEHWRCVCEVRVVTIHTQTISPCDIWSLNKLTYNRSSPAHIYLINPVNPWEVIPSLHTQVRTRKKSCGLLKLQKFMLCLGTFSFHYISILVQNSYRTVSV